MSDYETLLHLLFDLEHACSMQVQAESSVSARNYEAERERIRCEILTLFVVPPEQRKMRLAAITESTESYQPAQGLAESYDADGGGTPAEEMAQELEAHV